MNEKIVCEVMLFAYKDLEKQCEKVEAQALRFALGSRNRDVFESVETLLKLTDEKIAYCNIKVIIDEALKSIGRNVELIDYYINGLDYKAIIEREKIYERMFFRRIKRQKELLCKAILKQYDVDYLFAMIRESEWLTKQYQTTLDFKTRGLKQHRSSEK